MEFGYMTGSSTKPAKSKSASKRRARAPARSRAATLQGLASRAVLESRLEHIRDRLSLIEEILEIEEVEVANSSSSTGGVN